MNFAAEIGKIFAAASPITRGAKQLEIERAISAFYPDYLEASEIVAAVHAALRTRYDDLLGVELEHLFKQLGEQLEEADSTPSKPDEMDLSRWAAEKDWDKQIADDAKLIESDK